MLKTEKNKQRILTIKDLHGVVEKGSCFNDKKGMHDWLTVQFNRGGERFAFCPTLDSSKIRIYKCLQEGKYRKMDSEFDFDFFMWAITQESRFKVLTIFYELHASFNEKDALQYEKQYCIIA